MNYGSYYDHPMRDVEKKIEQLEEEIKVLKIENKRLIKFINTLTKD